MFHVFAITSESRLADSLERYYKYKSVRQASWAGGEQGKSESYSVQPNHEFSRILFSEDRIRGQPPAQAFRRIADEIEYNIENHGTLTDLHEAVAILDVCDEKLSGLEALNPIKPDIGHWPVVASMLILAYPEVHWLLHTPYRSEESSLIDDAHFLSVSNFSAHNGLTLRQRGFSSLLDPIGLRDMVRQSTARTKNDEDERVVPHIPPRDEVAAAIDDEEAHAYFNAYAAYRFGYRACPVTNRYTMQKTLGSDDRFLEPSLLLEDLYLGFPDRSGNEFLSNLKKRGEDFPGLESDSITHRLFVTVGHRRTEKTRGYRHDNWRYLHEFRQRTTSDGKPVRVKTLYKPLSGIFRLWKDAGLLRNDGTPRLPGEFEWPPKPDYHSDEGHSAPGRLLMIAEHLIGRSKRILENASDVPDTVHAATLALEAKEVLADKTPTTALEALGLQHRAEIVAESMFWGVEFNLDLESRFKEITREVEAIGRWFNIRRRKRVKINARLAIVEDLARKFSELDQFEEERKCRAEARRLYFDFWALQSPWRLPFLPFLRYLSLSLRSLPVFFCLVALWILLFGVGYSILDPYVFDFVKIDGTPRFGEAFSTSTMYFFTLQMPGSDWYAASKPVLWNSILAFQSVVSLSHLGILVSHIYLIVSRR